MKDVTFTFNADKEKLDIAIGDEIFTIKYFFMHAHDGDDITYDRTIEEKETIKLIKTLVGNL